MTDAQYQGLIAQMYSQQQDIQTYSNVVVHWQAGACVLLGFLIFVVAVMLLMGAHKV